MSKTVGIMVSANETQALGDIESNPWTVIAIDLSFTETEYLELCRKKYIIPYSALLLEARNFFSPILCRINKLQNAEWEYAWGDAYIYENDNICITMEYAVYDNKKTSPEEREKLRNGFKKYLEQTVKDMDNVILTLL